MMIMHALCILIVSGSLGPVHDGHACSLPRLLVHLMGLASTQLLCFRMHLAGSWNLASKHLDNGGDAAHSPALA